MSVWAERLAVEEASRVVRRALACGYLQGDVTAAVFHDLDRVRSKLAELGAAFPPSTLHAVAIKANPLIEVLRAVVDAGAGLEAASMEEVHLALAAGCSPSRVIFDSPAKTTAELAMAISLGVHVNADNPDELERIAAIRQATSSKSIVGLRLNPLVGGGAIAATSVATRGSQFGVPIDVGIDALQALLSRYPWITALHVHVGSQGCGLPMLTQATAKIASLMFELNRRLGEARIVTLDIGGGLPIAYRDGEHAPTPADYVEALRGAVPAIFEAPYRLITELGRSIHASAGWAVSRVEYTKRAGDERMAVIHLGADFLLRRVYQPNDWHHDMTVLDAGGRVKSSPTEPWSIVGPLCFAGDVIARGAALPPIESGDFILLSDVGAYTMGMWSRHCSRAMPLVLGVRGERLLVLKARETTADVVAFWSRGDLPRKVSG